MEIDWKLILQRRPRGEPYPNLANAARVLQNDPSLGPEQLWYDITLDRIFIARGHPPREWTPEDDIKLTVYMQSPPLNIHRMAPSTVRKAVRYVAIDRAKRSWLPNAEVTR